MKANCKESKQTTSPQTDGQDLVEDGDEKLEEDGKPEEKSKVFIHGFFMIHPDWVSVNKIPKFN